MKLKRRDTNQRNGIDFESWVRNAAELRARIGHTMSKLKINCGSATALLLCSLPALRPIRQPAEQRQTSTPYKGDLSIFETPGRDEALQINRVMDVLGIAPGKRVADIGAGSGWFTVRAARRVTGTGRVYAVDINPRSNSLYSRSHQERKASATSKRSSANPTTLACPRKLTRCCC